MGRSATKSTARNALNRSWKINSQRRNREALRLTDMQNDHRLKPYAQRALRNL
jgi:hypothetical protein